MLKKPIQQQIDNKLELREGMNGNMSEISINRHFINAALRSKKWSPNGPKDCNGNCEDLRPASLTGNIYVEVRDSGHLNECFTDCRSIKNTHL